MSDDYIQKKDILYREPMKWDETYSQLDIYYRDNCSEKKPVIIFIHGGGWERGDKNNIEKSPNLIRFFLDQGMVVVSVNFRLINKLNLLAVGYRHQAEDIAYALKWIFKSVHLYGGLNNYFIFLGYSSGAHLASLVATDTRYIKQVDIPVTYIRGVIALDVFAYDIPLALELMQGTSLGDNRSIHETIFGKTKKEQMRASPAYFVFYSKMPFLLVSTGIKDYESQDITRKVTESFKRTLIKANHQVTHIHYKERSHHAFLLNLGGKGEPLNKAIIRFIEPLLRNSERTFDLKRL